MEKRQLGTTNMFVNRIGLGCMGFSHAYGPAMEKKEAIQTLQKAHAIGYDFYDTAECYLGTYEDGTIANNEEVVGEAIHAFRDEIVLASKFGVRHMGDHLEMDSSPETIRHSIEGTLTRLKTDHLDLYYQHRIDPKVAPETVAETMKELIKEGKIRSWGISETSEEYLRRAHAVCPVTCIENRYSMMASWYEELFPVCEELGVTYVAFSPLANGLLSGKYTPSDRFAQGDFRNRMPQYQEEGYRKAQALLDLLQTIAAEKNCTMAQLSLAWMVCKKPFIVPIPGSRKIARLEENFRAGNVEVAEDEIKAIDEKLSSMDFSVFGGH